MPRYDLCFPFRLELFFHSRKGQLEQNLEKQMELAPFVLGQWPPYLLRGLHLDPEVGESRLQTLREFKGIASEKNVPMVLSEFAGCSGGCPNITKCASLFCSHSLTDTCICLPLPPVQWLAAFGTRTFSVKCSKQVFTKCIAR